MTSLLLRASVLAPQMTQAARLTFGSASARPLCKAGKSFRSTVNSRQMSVKAGQGKSVEGIGSKVVVISGNRGLGLEVAKEAVNKGLDVVVTCRKSSEELDSMKDKVSIMTGLDVTKESAPQDLEKFIRDKGWDKIDAVMSISGLLTFDSLDDLATDKMELMYKVCAMGPLCLFAHLLKCGLLSEGSKIGQITSEGGSIGLRTDTEGGGNYGHHMSKCAQNMMGKLLAIDLKGKGIPVVNIHPGFIKTEMTSKFPDGVYDQYGAIPPEQAAPGVWEAVQRATLENTGKFMAPQGTESLGFGLEGLEQPEKVGKFDALPW